MNMKWIGATCLVLAACGAVEPNVPENGGYVSEVYSADDMWLCRPDLGAADWCASDLTGTRLFADGSEELVIPEPAPDPVFDCFYVYPTVALTDDGSAEDFSEPGDRLDPLLAQAAPLNRHCAVYAPYYRQAALTGDWETQFDIATGDVRDAFFHFIDQYSDGRPFMLVGHSQGTAHLARVLAEDIEADDDLHARLVSAVLLGGNLTVPEGEVVGGTFARTPICEDSGQTGCLVAWVTYSSERPPVETDLFGAAPSGSKVVCTDPVGLAGGTALGESWFPTFFEGAAFALGSQIYPEYDTPFVRVGDMFRAACVDSGAHQVLQVTPDQSAEDTRELAPYRNGIAEATGFGMHLVDYNIATGDLLELVRLQSEAL